MKSKFKKAYYRKIPAYYDVMTNEVVGRIPIYDIAIEIMIWIDTYIIEVDEYPIYIEDND